MRIKRFEVKLLNGEVVLCSSVGQGDRIAFIPGGPGSFYFKGLKCLYAIYTIVTCDSFWTYGKKSELKEKKVESITLESIKDRDHLVVLALKSHFKTDQIDGLGFSAPGSVLLEGACQYLHDYSNIICTGIGLTELDPTFKKTNEFFYRNASEKKKKLFEQYQAAYQALEKAIKNEELSANPHLANLFGLKPTTKTPLNPSKKFVAETMAMLPKAICDDGDLEQSKQRIIEHWKHNPFGEHINKQAQEHFFKAIYPRVNTMKLLEKLAKSGVNILLVFGEQDYITPLAKDVLDKLMEFQNIKVAIIKNCAHMPYIESPTEYVEAIIKFTQPSLNYRIQAKL